MTVLLRTIPYQSLQHQTKLVLLNWFHYSILYWVVFASTSADFPMTLCSLQSWRGYKKYLLKSVSPTYTIKTSIKAGNSLNKLNAFSFQTLETQHFKILSDVTLVYFLKIQGPVCRW